MLSRPPRRLGYAKVMSTAAVFVALGTAGSAVASPQFDSSYKLKLTTAKGAASTGWSLDASLRDPGDALKRPKILTGLRINFPKGTRFDPKGHASCRVTDKQAVESTPEEVCPGTSYGTGQAKVIVGSAPLAFPIQSYNIVPVDFGKRKPELLLYVELDPNNPELAFQVEGELSKSSIFFSLASAPEFDIHTTRIRFKLPASRRGKHVFTRTPASCPRSKRWTAKVKATFADGSNETQPITLPCRRR